MENYYWFYLLVVLICILNLCYCHCIYYLSQTFSANLIYCNLLCASITCSFSNSISKSFCFSRSSFFLSNLSFAWNASNLASAFLRLVLSRMTYHDLEDLKCFEKDFEEEHFEDFYLEPWLDQILILKRHGVVLVESQVCYSEPLVVL